MVNVALCCIAKNENLYIREFIEHYKSLNFNHIFIYDNNDELDERFEDVINDYIESGYVTIIDYRDQKKAQIKAYQECYETYKNEYDWIAFFDCDEFLVLNNYRTIQEYLDREVFNKISIIRVNFMIYSDSGNYQYYDAPLKERFTIPAKTPKTFYKNCEAKSIIRCIEKEMIWYKTPYEVPNCPFIGWGEYGCLNNGTFCFPYNNFLHIINYDECYLIHYMYKSIDEYINKIKRGWPHGEQYVNPHKIVNDYFEVNEFSSEKMSYLAYKLKNI